MSAFISAEEFAQGVLDAATKAVDETCPDAAPEEKAEVRRKVILGIGLSLGVPVDLKELEE